MPSQLSCFVLAYHINSLCPQPPFEVQPSLRRSKHQKLQTALYRFGLHPCLLPDAVLLSWCLWECHGLPPHDHPPTAPSTSLTYDVYQHDTDFKMKSLAPTGHTFEPDLMQYQYQLDFSIYNVAKLYELIHFLCPELRVELEVWVMEFKTTSEWLFLKLPLIFKQE